MATAPRKRVQRGTKRPSGKTKRKISHRNIASSHTKRIGSSSQGTARSSAKSVCIGIPQDTISVMANSIAAQSSDRRQKISRPVAANATRGIRNATTMVT
jgi:hypothetical protein